MDIIIVPILILLLLSSLLYITIREVRRFVWGIIVLVFGRRRFLAMLFFVALFFLAYTLPENDPEIPGYDRRSAMTNQYIMLGVVGLFSALSLVSELVIDNREDPLNPIKKKVDRLIVVVYVLLFVASFDAVIGLGRIPDFIQVATFIILMLAFLYGVPLPGSD